ncbi:MAG: hypothetical protein LBJ59_01620 [Zoogloeaceae bacterium]|jgi:hypothetical protein|nr:hypothetical protein [Zoogloeaceae bacterium]
MAEQMRQAATAVGRELPDVIERDEIHAFVKKNSGAPSFGLLIADGNVVLLRMKPEKASLPP